MTSIRSVKNQYRGINAHLHSLWQNDSGWSGFHTVHIGYLLSALRANLRSMGYTADAEKSLQIRRIDTPPKAPHRADVLIYDLDPKRAAQPLASSITKPLLTVAEVLDENTIDEKPYQAIVIYQRAADSGKRGEPVAWIELLSPSNKGSTTDADLYRRKRRQVLDSGLIFVELDYLHETPPTFTTISPAHPYRIIVLDPRPNLDEGPAWIEEFNVDDPIPTVEIPLNAGDMLKFDFNAPYQKMFEESFFGDDVDYAELPENFMRYNSADQQRIACRMLAILKAAKAGANLEANSPLPPENLSLEAALSQLKNLTAI